MKTLFRKQLKAQAHHLNPVLIVGAQGLTPALHKELEVTLEAHELIKIRVNAADRNERKLMIQEILEAHQAELVQQVGHIATIYRKNRQD